MNLDGQCPNKHFADCDICKPNGNELKAQREKELANLIDIGYVPAEDISEGLVIRFDRESAYETIFATADIKKGQRYYEYPTDPRKVMAVYKQI